MTSFAVYGRLSPVDADERSLEEVGSADDVIAAKPPVDPVTAAEARGSHLVGPTVPVLIAGDGTVLVTIANAARLSAVSIRTVYHWIAQGKVEVRLTPGGHKRVVVSSLFTEAKA